jgi:hypothetical protein
MSARSAADPTGSAFDLGAELQSAVQSVGETLTADHLAFLAATRKFEEPVRDVIAWRLHQRLASTGLVVSREFPVGPRARADIAILDGVTPAAIVELKALYAFNVHSESSRNEYRGKVAGDLERTALHAPNADAYAIALATHVVGDIPQSLLKVVKYAKDIQRANVKYGDADQLRTDALPIWLAAMEGLGAAVQHIMLGSGRVWTLRVTVDAWLVGPVPRGTLAAASS